MANGLGGLVEAAKAGNAQALTALAHAQALGFCTTRNINIALDNLARAASVGWPAATRELQVLARSAGANWKQLRSSVDPEAWRRSSSRRVLFEAPRLRVFEGFAASEECDWLVEACRDKLQRSSL